MQKPTSTEASHALMAIGSVPHGRELPDWYERQGSWGLERETGIEPAYPAWKAGALPLSYSRPTQHLQYTSLHGGIRTGCPWASRARTSVPFYHTHGEPGNPEPTNAAACG